MSDHPSVAADRRPLPYGFSTDVDRIDAPLLVPKSNFSIDALSREFTFFSHAGLFEWAEMVDDPLLDWWTPECRVLKQAFEHSIFNGLKRTTDVPGCSYPVPWSNVLLAVDTAFWMSLKGFIGGLTAVNRQTRQVYCPSWANASLMLPGCSDPVKVWAVEVAGRDTCYTWVAATRGFLSARAYPSPPGFGIVADAVLDNPNTIAKRFNPVLIPETEP